MSAVPPRRSPGAFRPSEVEVTLEDDGLALDEAAAEAEIMAAPRPPDRRGFAWGRLFLAALGVLVSLAIAAATADLVNALFALDGWLGWFALAVAALAGLAFVGLAMREILGIFRLSRLRRIREAAAAPVLTDAGAREILATLSSLYGGRAELARARAEVASHDREVVDPDDRLTIAERAYMSALDAEARRLIGDAAKRVSIVTAVSPAAIVDLGVVLIVQLGLIRRIATLYGGRPGFFGLIRLARIVLTHLAVTGSIALGDDLIQQMVGHGLAARLSTRLGEGVLNGLMTARVGLAALDVCRPLPFRAIPRPRVTDFVTALRADRAAADSGSKKP